MPIIALNGDKMTFPFSSVVMLKTVTLKWPLPCIICYTVCCALKRRAGDPSVPHMAHCLGNAIQCAPLQSMLLSLLVENKLLVSQRRAGGPWTQKCVRCGAPMRVASRFHPTASDKPAGEMESVLWAVEEEFCTTAGCVWKVCQRYFLSL